MLDHPANPSATPARIDGLRALMRRGDYLQAHDLAAAAVDAGEADPELRFLAVLALARSGASGSARRRYAEYGLDTLDPGLLSDTLKDDLSVLAARLDKDEALAHPDRRAEWARRSAAGYKAAFDRSGLTYHGVNAATMWLLAGDDARARAEAATALDDGRLQNHAYWDSATEAEAALILADLPRAEAALHAAAAAGPKLFSERATTVKQLELVCGIARVDPSTLDPVRNPPVIHYCGHRILAPGERGRFRASDEARVRSAIDDALAGMGVAFGFGSLAGGADIIAAEALLDRGAELHVVLPFLQDEFVRASVASAGVEWIRRFESCLARAHSVEMATNGEYLDDPVLFDFCARVAMGDAIMRADFLAAEAHQIAVWDGTPSEAPAGTAVDIATWAATGRSTVVIPVESTPGVTGGGRGSSLREIRGIVAGDFAGFSKLTDRQVLVFQREVMGALAAALEPLEAEILSGRTWGDGLSFVTTDVSAAAGCALALQQSSASIDFASIGLPSITGLRVAAHAAPVFEGSDPIARSRGFFGAGFTQTARIEPRTPEGEIYTTKPFGALAMLIPDRHYETQYVGTLPTAKGYGALPLFALRRRRPSPIFAD